MISPAVQNLLNVKDASCLCKKCCICGKTFMYFGNNPYPLCKDKEADLVCCNDCDNFVTKARFLQMEAGIPDEEDINIGDVIAVLWSDRTPEPLDSLRKTGRFLAGRVSKIKGKKFYGTWGDFGVNPKKDRVVILDRSYK